MSQPITLADFDVASQSGLREKLALLYTHFRTVQADSQPTLSDLSVLTPRSYCPCCHADITQSTILFTKYHMPHAQCQQCGLVYTHVTLKTEVDAAQYDDTVFMRTYSALKQHPVYAHLETTKINYLLQRTKMHAPEMHTVLDIGASNGAFMAAAQALGLDTYGIEPDSSVAGTLHARYGQHFVNGYFPQDIPNNWPQFDLITLLDVLEHMVEPLPFLGSLRHQLNSHGLVFIQVPNFQSLLIQLDGSKNANFGTGHLQHFTPATLRDIMQRAGYRPLEIGTYISELDRIHDHPPEAIRATMQQLIGQDVVPQTPEALYAHHLGYKLYGLFALQSHGST